jgi:hypothetical protein
MDNKILLIALFIGLVTVCGCAKEVTLGDKLNNAPIPESYVIVHRGNDDSSGASRYYNFEFTVVDEELVEPCSGNYTYSGTSGVKKVYDCTDYTSGKNIGYSFPMSSIKNNNLNLNLNITEFKHVSDRDCYCDTYRYIVCFDERGMIVNFEYSYGPYNFRWNVKGYDFTDEISDVMYGRT